jgi:hypothetical protein
MKIYRHFDAATLMLVLAVSGLASARPAAASPDTTRFAVVIGNSNYPGEEVSGEKDARAMEQYLKQLDFTVLEPVLNGSREQMINRLKDLGPLIRGRASVVVFFYSGHGYQQDHENYLMPVGGSIDPASSVPLRRVQEELALAPDGAIKLILLDACRDEQNLPKGALRGFDQSQAPSLPHTLYAFATGPNQSAPSGTALGFSPYTSALLEHLRDPGLELVDLLDQVHTRLEKRGQLPSFVNYGVPGTFTLRAPVLVRAKVEKADDDLLVILNDKIVLDANEASERDLRLNAGRNDLTLLVSNGKTFHNGQTWERTEGWSYDLALSRPDGTEILCSDNGQPVRCFKDQGETEPFKDGPHHGKVFTVASAVLFVNEDPAKPLLTIPDRHTDVWNVTAPVWARDQRALYQESVVSLDLSPEAILGGTIDLGGFGVFAPFVRQALVELLRTGKIAGFVVADPARTFVTVRGNQALAPLVDICMRERREDRKRDLIASIAAAFKRDPRPFDLFDQRLNQCVRDTGEKGGSPLRSDDMRVWTALEDRSRE